MPELEFDSATTKMSLVTVPTMETVAISFWLDNLLPNKHGAMLIGAAGCGKTAMINGKMRSLPEEFASTTININCAPSPRALQPRSSATASGAPAVALQLDRATVTAPCLARELRGSCEGRRATAQAV